jgi:vancomycin resistance protein YoaR
MTSNTFSPYAPSKPEPRLNPWLIRLPILVISGAILLGLILTIIVGGFQLLYTNRIFPNIYANGINLSGMTPEQAVAALYAAFTYDDQTVFTFRDSADPSRFWQASAADLGVSLDAETTVAQAFAVGHGGGFFDNLVDQALAWLNGENFSAAIRYDQNAAAAFLAGIAEAIYRAPADATLTINGADIQAAPGASGRSLDLTTTLNRLDNAIITMQPGGELALAINETPPVSLDAQYAADRARVALSAPVILVADDGRGGALGPWTVSLDQITALLDVETITEADGSQRYEVAVDTSVYRPALEALAPGLIVPAANGRFHFDPTTRQLVNTQAAVDGRRLNVDETLLRLQNAVFDPVNRTVPLAFDYEPAQYHNAVTAAELGISELVSEGISYYTGSTEARRTNISQAVSRFDGLIIAPGEEFSFNQYVGDISPEEGFVEGFVIMGDQTVRGVGGGVCQVSTTVFRAAFYAGFPITERFAHGYRVGYYEDSIEGVGMDAAIYTPDLDFRFLNDTPYHLLIQAFVNPANNSVHFQFYSTNPGRQVVREATEIAAVQPPAATQYVVNPDLTAGQQVQVDWAAPGAYVRIERVITDLSGTPIRRDVIASQYQPWGAVVQVAPGDPLAG